MAYKLPIFLILCVLTIGAVQIALSTQPADPAEQPGLTQPPADMASTPRVDPSGAARPKPSGAVPGTAADAESLMVRAIEAMETCTTISATILHETFLYDKHLVGSGLYLGQWRNDDHLTRLELKIQVGQDTSSLVQVCDGRHLWTRRRLLGEDRLTKIDVARAKWSIERHRKAGRPHNMGVLPGIGGLPRIFRGLHGAFDFDSVESGTWGKRKQPVWKIRGRWKPGALARVFPEKEDAIRSGELPEPSELPPFLPDHVVVFLVAQEKPFPFRVEYRRTIAEGQRTDGVSSRAIVTMELSNVRINVPIAAERFIYNPGRLDAADETDKFLRALGTGLQ